MFFTDYFCIEDIELSDPLGLRVHTSKLIDILLPQFTGNTHTPAYFGLLCAIYKLKEDLNISQKDFNKFARGIEFIWGIMCIESNKADDVLNKNKFTAAYEELKKDKKITLKQIRNSSIYSKYSYGVIGHYKQPAKKWGLLNPDESLTLLGKDLANFWNQRKTRNSFISLIKTIYSERINISTLKKYSQYALSALPSTSEKEFWKDRIDSIDPLAKKLWKKLKSINKYESNEQIFKCLENSSPELKQIIETYQWYEQTTAIINFLFDYEYHRKHNNIALNKFPDLVNEAVRFLQNLLNEDRKIENLPSKPKILQIEVKDYHTIIADSIRCHIEHQKSKKRQAYFDENRNILLAKNCDTIKEILDNKISKPEELVKYYHIDFFFKKVITWNDYVK